MDRERWIEQLRDADADVRAEAREELAMEIDDDVARAFLDVATGDAPEAVRADAIVGLGPVIEEAGMDFFDDTPLTSEYDEPPVTREMFGTIVGTIRKLYDDESQPKLIRRRAFEVLVRDPQQWQADEIRSRYASDDPEWKRTAMFGMGHVAGFEKEIEDAIGSSDGPMLYEAVRAAGRMEVFQTAVAIRKIAADDVADADLRIVAIEALPYVDDECQELLEELSSDSDRDIAEAAEAALDELSMFE